MSETSKEKKVHGLFAEYDSVDSLLAACRRVRDAGYTKTDAFAPFAVHGIDTALGIKPSKLPFIALGGGLTGTVIALLMQIWMNGINYPYIISGKPYVLSLPAFMPVAFELTVLLASFGAFFGMWALNGLPRFSNPMFTDPRFDRATDDKFFLFIDSRDQRFDADGVRQLFSDTGSQYINTVVEDDSPTRIPRFLPLIWFAMIGFSIVPLLIVAKMRVTNSSKPRFHVFYDMDFSPARDAQQTTSLFADSRAMRPDVPGTVARGQLDDGLDFLTGINIDKLTSQDPPRAERLVRTFLAPAADESPADAADAPGDAQPSVMDTTPWLQENPLKLTSAALEQGQEQFNIYCAACHGRNGKGNGLVNQRAQKILAQQWIPPASLHQPALYSDKYPDGKLFSTISNGIRKMPGYAGQIKTRDRWAIVAYVRALQQSQAASIDLIPADQRESLEKLKAEIDKKLAEQAEAEKKKQAEAEAKQKAAA
jgi:mono/diheme cytochrome c family protein